jgi:hypothetical protein
VARTPAAGARPDRLLRTNPVLMLPGLQSPESVAELVAAWNPLADVGGDGGRVADAVRWHGPIRLTPMLRADAGLSGGQGSASSGLAYVAEVKRERTRVVDSRYADVLRRSYPRGVPTGAEAEAWQLIRGLAKRLRGVARLPGCPLYAPFRDARPLPGETDRRVFSHEMLPWIVLREILRPLAPDLAREALPGGAGYVLRQRGLLEIRVRPADRSTPVPYALRDRVDDAWPHSVYEFCDLAGEFAADRLISPVPGWTMYGSDVADGVDRPEREYRADRRDRRDREDREDRADRRDHANRPAPTANPESPAASAVPSPFPSPFRRPHSTPRVPANAAVLIAEVTGGVLLDTDGFTVPIRATAAR